MRWIAAWMAVSLIIAIGITVFVAVLQVIGRLPIPFAALALGASMAVPITIYAMRNP